MTADGLAATRPDGHIGGLRTDGHNRGRRIAKPLRWWAQAIVLCACPGALAANDVVPFPFIQVLPYWAWEITWGTAAWALMNLALCILVEGLIYNQIGILTRPYRASTIANLVTTLVGFVVAIVGILTMQVGYGVITLGAPVVITIAVEYVVVRRYAKPNVRRGTLIGSVILANVVSNAIIITWLVVKARHAMSA